MFFLIDFKKTRFTINHIILVFAIISGNSIFKKFLINKIKKLILRKNLLRNYSWKRKLSDQIRIKRKVNVSIQNSSELLRMPKHMLKLCSLKKCFMDFIQKFKNLLLLETRINQIQKGHLKWFKKQKLICFNITLELLVIHCRKRVNKNQISF
jgi:hypothetical protein